jgi:hypothetical protein
MFHDILTQKMVLLPVEVFSSAVEEKTKQIKQH